MPEHICTCQSIHRLRTLNPTAYQTILDIADLLVSKAADYSISGNSFMTFSSAALDSDVAVDSVFRTLIGVKTAREIALLSSGNEPNYESLQDTRMDRACYCILQCAYHSDADS